MDTLSAFIRGQASKGHPERVFDWVTAAQIIVNARITEAEAGLEGDWEWTGGKILTRGQPVPARDTYTYLSSTWAIPMLSICGEGYLPCWIWQADTEWDSDTYWPDEALAIIGSTIPEELDGHR